MTRLQQRHAITALIVAVKGGIEELQCRRYLAAYASIPSPT
ncbi:hypothetical protein VOI32_33010 [Paraburkholderia caribensis]|uniref:Transposase n=1 Tax=Paraburkholderia caribensis TaxID=75105 RepID=A0ABV0E9K9_9BURK|nr:MULTISPECIES: hypothetical protein [Paraburkholderia]